MKKNNLFFFISALILLLTELSCSAAISAAARQEIASIKAGDEMIVSLPVEEDKNTADQITEDPRDTVSPPKEFFLSSVPFQSQIGLAPTGCEMVCAMMALHYRGVDISFNEIAENANCVYPRQIGGRCYAPHPKDAFIGSPFDMTSFGCYAPPIVSVLNSFLPDGISAYDTTGTALAELAETELPAGNPVLVWATMNMAESYEEIGWYLLDENGNPTDTWFFWKANEHCLVLIGYDEENYYFHDPLCSQGNVAYPKDLVERRYEEIGKYSIVVR